MLMIKIPQEMLEEVRNRAKDFGFTSTEEFICYVLEELLEAIRNKDSRVKNKRSSEREQKELRAKLQDLGYM